jgi:hypothetical protein
LLWNVHRSRPAGRSSWASANSWVPKPRPVRSGSTYSWSTQSPSRTSRATGRPAPRSARPLWSPLLPQRTKPERRLRSARVVGWPGWRRGATAAIGWRGARLPLSWLVVARQLFLRPGRSHSQTALVPERQSARPRLRLRCRLGKHKSARLVRTMSRVIEFRALRQAAGVVIWRPVSADTGWPNLTLGPAIGLPVRRV